MYDNSTSDDWYRRWIRRTTLTLLLISVTVLSGCASAYRQAYSPTGHILNNYAKDHMIPYLLSTEDVGMACATGKSTAGLLLSFQRVIPKPKKTGLAALLTAGLCSRAEAFEAELRAKRAIYNGNATAAQDAQMEKNQHLITTARRRYRAYKMFKKEYGEPGVTQGNNVLCPTFESKQDRMFYLMGLLTGVQAVNNDLASGRQVGVPQDIIPKASRASNCLDNRKWWGVPMALRAVTWTTLPGSKPDGVDPWKRLDRATQIADQTGVRLAYAFKVLAADNKGKMDLVKQTIKEAVESRKKRSAPKKYRLLDKMAFQQMKMVSDRMWTENTGHRTPPGQLGTFWETKEESQTSGENLDKLLP